MGIKSPEFNIIENGNIDWTAIKLYFNHIKNQVNDAIANTFAILKRNTMGCVYAINERGKTIIIKQAKHMRIKITNAWVMLADDLEEEVIVEIENITNPIYFSSSETRGSVKIFDIKDSIVHFIEPVVVSNSSNRRLLVGVVYEYNE